MQSSSNPLTGCSIPIILGHKSKDNAILIFHREKFLWITLGLVSRDDTIPLQHHCSPFRGRPFRTRPSLSRKYSNFTRDRGFVNTSTTCSSVLTYWRFMAPFCIISRIYKYQISMCCDLSWNTRFYVIFIQL